MSDWSQQISDWLGEVADQAEAVLLDVSETVDANLGPIAETAEKFGAELADQLDHSVTPWLEELLQPLLDTPLDIDVELDQAIADLSRPWRQTIEPPLNNHPVCTGCKHYHGESYGGNLLVCGMYPYGHAADQTTCVDKADIDWQEPWKTWFDQTWPPQNWDL
ncbi:hypothetical protein IQ266_15625 [filamentous cyanobacterium LEGE 11480]|uniref:Uncharacterized protein n=1 Tax=Romeriopsis navalis LEGE 11480 TaxID=2777977 RepID=A0A928VS94_9CYAN|nr:hypothetical protein [Romeriopsis navalis]MBE9031164.1 hypothetical protein [Romeriopsis navalis LEGE 11480]